MGITRAKHSGQILVVFAITAASMLAVVGLLYSFGLILAQRRSLQTAADAASLSGAWCIVRELASDNRSDSNVLGAIVQLATTNGADQSNVSAVYVDASGAQLAVVGSGGTFPVAARGVHVGVKSQVPTVLPGFLGVWQVLVQGSATAVAAPTAAPASASLVLPIAASASAYVPHGTYDLFGQALPGGQPPTLNLTTAAAPSFGPPATNEQYWSDGQHSGSWLLTAPRSVTLADAAYFDAIATGLHDNVRRQGLVDASGAAYALVTVPMYDTATSSNVHIVGFAQLKLRGADITPTSARGTFVLYPASAFGVPVAPSPDLGAVVVRLAS
jgi:Putative Flp pilus-assembly TadE/G-like